MLKFGLKILGLLLPVVLLSGCVATSQPLPLYYSFHTNSSGMLKAKSRAHISLEVLDRRIYKDPNMILPYSLSRSGSSEDKGYVAEKPFTQIVQSGLAAGLRNMGYVVSRHANYRLVCEIVEVRSALVQADLQASLKVSLHLYDDANQAIIWQSFLVGRGNVTGFIKNEDDLANAINRSISHVVWSLQESRDFVRALK